MFHASSKKDDNLTELIPLTGNSSNTLLPVEPEHFPEYQAPQSNLESVRKSSLKSAWRFVVQSGALTGGFVLVVNLVTFIVVYTHFPVQNSTSVVYEGSCDVTSGVTIGSHIVINVFSTILLAYSNYAMQCLSAPSRTEVDRAHGKHQWLSIGTPNIRNLTFVSGSKIALWLLLCMSSFPLHFLWNSTVFQTQMSQMYLAIAVTPDFVAGGPWLSSAGNDSLSTNATDLVQKLQNEASHYPTSLQYLDADSCIRAYSTDTLVKYRNLILVVDYSNATTANNSLLAVYDSRLEEFGNSKTYDDCWGFAWMCDDASYGIPEWDTGAGWICINNLLQHSQWIPGQSDAANVMYGNQGGHPVAFCYAEPVLEEHCKVNIVPTFLIVVAICNVFKVVAFTLCLYITRSNRPLLTTGDAIQSFIERPDIYTKERCLVSKCDYDGPWFRRSRYWQPRADSAGDTWDADWSRAWITKGKPIHPDPTSDTKNIGRFHGRYRWGKAVRARQWNTYMFFVCGAILCAWEAYAPDGLAESSSFFFASETWSNVFKQSLGKPHGNFNIGNGTSIPVLAGFLLANVPQFVVSYLYLGLSNILTTMIAMAEWTSYGQSARGLRVSTPKSGTAQRSTYFLSLPYRYAVPMLLFVTTVHYFVSEMVFLAQIEWYDYQGDLAAATTQIFFSPLAMLIAVTLGSTIVVALVLLGVFKKHPGNMPLAACCSASIAAACQPGLGRERLRGDLALGEVQWGVVGYDEHDVGHATFAAGGSGVDELQKGSRYM